MNKKTAPKKKLLTVAVDGKIHDGAGGFFKKGDALELNDPDAVNSLKERGLIK